ncbi:MAG: cupin domain-containing protein [Microcella sp.]
MDFVALDLARFATALMGTVEVAPTGVLIERLPSADDARLRVTGIAIAGGRELPEHDNPGEAMLQVLAGAVTLHSADGRQVPLTAGMLAPIPEARHRVEAHETSVLLLTQVPRS